MFKSTIQETVSTILFTQNYDILRNYKSIFTLMKIIYNKTQRKLLFTIQLTHDETFKNGSNFFFTSSISAVRGR